MESERDAAARGVNLGIFDGQVAHEEINRAIAGADKAVLLGEQTRLPFFPEDARLRKLHAGDPLVLFLWKVLTKIPTNLRDALIDGPVSLTLVRDDSLLYFRDCRCHQALHIGCRRRTVYIPEVLFHAAEERGYDHWAIAEGLIYTGWILLDYLLLTDVLAAYQVLVRATPNYRLGERLLTQLVEQHNRHRRESVDPGRSEVNEYVDGYKGRLIQLAGPEVAADEPAELALGLFDAEAEQRWARDKMERIAQVFNYPRMFLFDRDIIHGAARELAERRGQEIEPRSFADLLHDYRDAVRFEPDPLMTSFGKGVVPRPRALFLRRVVELGEKGLRGFFAAYRNGEPEVVELMHPLWMYLCSLSSDPAGVFSRAGRCRGLGRLGEEQGLVRALAGILIRLDQAPNYAGMVAEVVEMGPEAQQELVALVDQQRLEEEDEWEVFKARKQTIVTRAMEAVDLMQGTGRGEARAPRRSHLHHDELILQLLGDNPHRLTSDPSGLLMNLRAYHRSLDKFGPDDPDTDFLLAAVLVRLDRSEHYEHLLGEVRGLGLPAFSALHGVFEHIPERDQKRRTILRNARVLWAEMLAELRAGRPLEGAR